jgi:hypothetical protein
MHEHQSAEPDGVGQGQAPDHRRREDVTAAKDEGDGHSLVTRVDTAAVVTVPREKASAVAAPAELSCVIIEWSPFMSFTYGCQSWRKPVPERSTGSGPVIPA